MTGQPERPLEETGGPLVVTCNLGILGDFRCKKRRLKPCRGRCEWLPDEAGPVCYVCAGEAAADADPRYALCDGCAPVRNHVISMFREGVRLAAKCRCGATFIGADDQQEREAWVREHWLHVIAEAGR